MHRNGDLTVTDPERGSVRFPASYVARHVELGWAVTGYGSQGVTVDAGFAWIPDPTGRADPADALAEVIARPANAVTAHASRDRLYRQAGLAPPEQPASSSPAPAAPAE